MFRPRRRLKEDVDHSPPLRADAIVEKRLLVVLLVHSVPVLERALDALQRLSLRLRQLRGQRLVCLAHLRPGTHFF